MVCTTWHKKTKIFIFYIRSLENLEALIVGPFRAFFCTVDHTTSKTVISISLFLQYIPGCQNSKWFIIWDTWIKGFWDVIHYFYYYCYYHRYYYHCHYFYFILNEKRNFLYHIYENRLFTPPLFQMLKPFPRHIFSNPLEISGKFSDVSEGRERVRGEQMS